MVMTILLNGIGGIRGVPFCDHNLKKIKLQKISFFFVVHHWFYDRSGPARKAQKSVLNNPKPESFQGPPPGRALPWTKWIPWPPVFSTPPPFNKSWIRYCMIMDLCLSEQYTYQTKIIQTPHPKIPRKKDSTLVDLFWNVMSKYINFVFRFFIIVFCTCIAYLVITKLLILTQPGTV